MSAAPILLRISIPDQRLDLLRDGNVEWTAPVSTSAYGVGTEDGSLKTPPGLHRIAEKIGAGLPIGTRLVSRQPTGQLWPRDDDPAADWILTRILWLEGADPANANTKSRYIYLHGTNQEQKIGTPASHGCIRLRNPDIATLFDEVNVADAVEIVA